MAICSITVIPSSKGTSISDSVARCIKVLQDAPDLKFQITPMSTQIEGPLNRLFDVLKKMHEAAFADGVGRVNTSIVIDDRRDKEISMDYKVKAVQAKL
jgi:uncharacterized protein (TIGR00106 family)